MRARCRCSVPLVVQMFIESCKPLVVTEMPAWHRYTSRRTTLKSGDSIFRRFATNRVRLLCAQALSRTFCVVGHFCGRGRQKMVGNTEVECLQTDCQTNLGELNLAAGRSANCSSNLVIFYISIFWPALLRSWLRQLCRQRRTSPAYRTWPLLCAAAWHRRRPQSGGGPDQRTYARPAARRRHRL